MALDWMSQRNRPYMAMDPMSQRNTQYLPGAPAPVHAMPAMVAPNVTPSAPASAAPAAPASAMPERGESVSTPVGRSWAEARANPTPHNAQPYPGAVPVNVVAPKSNAQELSPTMQAYQMQQRRLQNLRAGMGGWLGLLQTGAAQKQLNALHGQLMSEGELGVKQGQLGQEQERLGLAAELGRGRLGLEGELGRRRADVEEGKLGLETRQAQPGINFGSAAWQAADKGYIDAAHQLMAVGQGKSPYDLEFTSGVGGIGTNIINRKAAAEAAAAGNGMAFAGPVSAAQQAPVGIFPSAVPLRKKQ